MNNDKPIRVVPLRAVLIGFAILLASSLWAIARVESEAQSRASDIRDAAVQICDEIGNGNRQAIREGLRREIARSQALDPNLFPDIPPARFKELVMEANTARQKQFEALAPIDCEARYPKL